MATADGGKTWGDQNQNSGFAGTLRNVSFADLKHGWAVGGDPATILHTTDGGKNWDNTWDPANSGVSDSRALLSSVKFRPNTADGWAVGSNTYNGLILHTTDGVGWGLHIPFGDVDYYVDVAVTDADHVWALGLASSGPVVVSSADAGKTWTETYLHYQDGSPLTDVPWGLAFAGDGQHGVIVGDNGLILRTSNGGYNSQDWVQAPSGTAQRLYRVAFPTADYGWAVGDGGVVAATSDGGQTWAAQDSGTTQPLLGVAFPDDQHGWAVGISGTSQTFSVPPRVLYTPHSTQPVCRLTGAGTNTDRVKISGTDLGYSFEHRVAKQTDGYSHELVFLFGDTIPATGPTGAAVRPWNLDSLAYSTDRYPANCMGLSFATEADGFYHPPPIDYPPGVPRLDTNDAKGDPNPALVIPSHGFSANRCPDGSEKIYIFFSSFSDGANQHPLRSLLESSCDRGQTFHYLYEVSSQHFINGSSVIVDSSTIPGLPQSSGPGLLVWGSGEYRMSDVYLAFVPLGRVEDRASWRYFRAPSSPGQPSWVGKESLATPVLTTTRSPQTQSPCVGEVSVTWNPVLGKWLALYNCNVLIGPSEVRFQVADRPWGPWSEFIESGPGGSTTVLFQPERDMAYGHIVNGVTQGFMHRASFKDGLDDKMFGKDRFGDGGDPYGPYVISRYTTGDARSTTIYYTMSTWNPYQVMLMRSNLRLERSPVANAGPEQTVSANNEGQAQVMLDGRASTDPDGDPLRYTWTGPFGTVTGATPTVTVPSGTSTITLTVDDGLGESASDEVEIVVRDTNPPSADVRARVSMLRAGASERR